jgi:hypothetical protein
MNRKTKPKTARIAAEMSVERLAEAMGVKLTRQGAELVAACPFHDDTGTSLVVRPDANSWRCDVCDTGGSAVEWVMKAQGVSRRHAAELLADGNPLKGIEMAGAVKLATVRKLAAPVTTDADDRELLRQVVDYYHSTLKSSPEALAYLAERGIGSREAVDRFTLGYSNRTLGLRLPAKNRKLGADLRGRLTRIGIYRESGHEHLSGSLVVPVFGGQGEVVQLYGRKTTPNLRAGTPLHLWLPGPSHGVWNREGIAGAKSVILAKSPIDALTFWCAGYRNVAAAIDPDGTGDDLLAALKGGGAKTVLLAWRRDADGEKAADAVAAKLLAHGLGCYRVQFPAGMDANDYARASADAPKALGQVLRQAIWLGKGQGPDLDLRLVMPQPESALPRDRTPEIAVSAAEEPVLPALPEIVTPEPSPPATPDVPADVKDEEVVIPLEGRRYRVRGLARNMSYDALRVNLLVTLDPEPPGIGPAFHADTLDLYSARQRSAFVKQAAVELGLRDETVKRDLGKVLLKLEELQEIQIRKALEPKRKAVALSDADRDAALDLLRDPRLVDRILADFERCGMVGEETNKLVAYLAAVSRKLDDPLAVIIQSSSAAGKTSLMEAVLAFVPEEDRLRFSAMTGQSLFYMGETDLQHRILAIAEEEGAERAAYALKLLQSEGELTIASTGKDPATGRLVAQEYRVQGPVMIFLTTTAIEQDEELLNRCIVLTVDEEREQTRAIHRLQRHRQTLEGLLARRDRDATLKLHRDAQRLLRPLLVANPYAPELTFLDDRTRTRRDHGKYLTLIRAITLLHQHQRPVKTIQHSGQQVEYVEVTLDDIALANRLAHEVLGRSLDDLPPQARRLLLLLDRMVAEGCARGGIERSAYRFNRRDVRDATGWSDFQVRTHIEKLVALEYVLVHRGGRGQLFAYELLYDGCGQDGQPFLVGLIEVEKLKIEGAKGDPEGTPSPHRAVTEAPSSPASEPEIASTDGTMLVEIGPEPEIAPQDTTSGTSYPHGEEGA